MEKPRQPQENQRQLQKFSGCPSESTAHRNTKAPARQRACLGGLEIAAVDDAIRAVGRVLENYR